MACFCELSKQLLALSSSRQHLSDDDCLEDKRVDDGLCAVICTHILTVLKVDCWFKFRFSISLGSFLYGFYYFLYCLLAVCGSRAVSKWVRVLSK